MATRVWESHVIDAPIATVWDLVRPLNFSYYPLVASATVEAKQAANEVGSTRQINYKDKTVQKLRLTELSDAKYTVSWDLVESIPAHHVMSASYTVRLRPITQGNLTFVEWVVDFSKDVTPAISIDASYKAKEHFAALAATAKAKLVEAAANAKLGKAKISVPQLTRQLSAKSQQLSALFAAADKNKNGTLEFDEFALVINKLYGENLSDEGIRLLLRDADTNNDNVVSYDEFVKFLASAGLEAKAQSLDQKQPALKLQYFPARGRAEVARLVMAEGGIKYTDERLDFATFQSTYKGKAPFGQMPVLEVDGKVQIAQSQAIVRYVSKLAGLYGRSAEDSARIDMIAELFYSDLGAAFGAAHYEKDAKLKEEKMAKFLNETVPTSLGYLEKILSQNKGGWFLGAQFSVADIIAFNDLSRLIGLKPEVLNATPLLHQLVTRVGSRVNIAAWVKARPVTQN